MSCCVVSCRVSAKAFQVAQRGSVRWTRYPLGFVMPVLLRFCDLTTASPLPKEQIV